MGTPPKERIAQDQAMEIVEQHLDQDSGTPPEVYMALHTLWKEAHGHEAEHEPTRCWAQALHGT